MSLEPDGGIVARAFEDAIVGIITHLSGIAPLVGAAPDLITDGVIGQIHISGGWSGTISAHCSADAVSFLEEQMPALLIDRGDDRQVAVVELLLESVANAFMWKFLLKSDVSEPKATPWGLSREPRKTAGRELWKISCSLPSGVFSFSASESSQ
jgi:hypothetical protein